MSSSAVDAGTDTAPATQPSDEAVTVPAQPRWLWIFKRRPGPLGLRRRILLIFTLGALGLATFLSFTTYGLVRSNLTSQRDSASLNQAYRNADQVARSLRGSESSDMDPAINALENTGIQDYVLRYRGRWSPTRGRYDERSIPAELVERVIDERTDARMVADVNGETVVVAGINLEPVQGAPSVRSLTRPTPPRRSPAGASIPASPPPRTPTSACWRRRSTTWRLRCSFASSATPDSHRT